MFEINAWNTTGISPLPKIKYESFTAQAYF
jgi:hypothetical protein